MPRNLQEGTLTSGLPQEFLAILRCPVTGVPLALSPVAADVDPARQGWLLAVDGSAAYPVRDGIACLTAADRIALTGGPGEAATDARRHAVQAFRDQIGWRQDATGAFHESGRFDDIRPVSAGYLHRCRARLRRHLPRRGRFLLDCASGPIAFDEYLAYSQGFARRICVDLSEVALRAARQRLGGHGIYVLADATRLPFAAASMDAVLSLNTLFHVPAGEQAQAMREFLRVVAPGAPVLVAYSWGDAAPLTRALIGAARRLHRLLRGRRPPAGAPSAAGGTADPVLYFHSHGLDFFRSLGLGRRLRVACWKALSAEVLRTYVRGPLSAALLLPLASAAETLLPGLMGRLGQQPLLVLRSE
ncbi:MAG: methyltransferase domain-containing protein [Paracraurococcus sp.]